MDYKEILEELGYRLIDSGAEWSAQAVYRGGDNAYAVTINKKSGLFYDFVTGEAGPIEKLIRLTGGEANSKVENILAKLEEKKTEDEERPKIKMDKIWPKEELDTLIPSYKAYQKDKNVSEQTLRAFHSGMKHEGPMYMRFVFPIFGSEGEIVGLSGRDMVGDRAPKWKHLGKKSNWIYPYFVPQMKKECDQDISKKGLIILVESIGDMLCLWERGHKNIFVTFGVKLSKALKAHLATFDADIAICLNNDFDKEVNVGKISSASMFIDLLSFFDYQRVFIAPPVGAGDFGHKNHDFKKWEETLKNPPRKQFYTEALEEMRRRYKKKKLSSNLIKIAKCISNDCDPELND